MISFVYLVIVLSNMYIQSWFRLGGRLNELNRTKENIHLHTFLDYLKNKKEENQINVKVCFVFALCTNHISLFISLVLSGQLPFCLGSIPPLPPPQWDYLCIDVCI